MVFTAQLKGVMMMLAPLRSPDATPVVRYKIRKVTTIATLNVHVRRRERSVATG
jgi:hypothetical protein